MPIQGRSPVVPSCGIGHSHCRCAIHQINSNCSLGAAADTRCQFVGDLQFVDIVQNYANILPIGCVVAAPVSVVTAGNRKTPTCSSSR